IFGQGTVKMFLGYLRPDPTISVNNWWNQNHAPYAYIPRNNATDFITRIAFGILATLQPISSLTQGNTGYMNLGMTEIVSRDGNSNTTARLRALYPATMSAVVGGLVEFAHIFSPDVMVAGIHGMYLGDYCTVGASQYAVWSADTSFNAKPLIRTA
ncbi:MAG: hypothetical protein ACKPGB_14855, partial [Dolichospermum sp.]